MSRTSRLLKGWGVYAAFVAIAQSALLAAALAASAPSPAHAQANPLRTLRSVLLRRGKSTQAKQVIQPSGYLLGGQALAGGGGTSIGGVAIGAAGTGYTAGFRLAGGTDFDVLPLVTASNPSGDFIPSHRRRGRRAINSASTGYYWTPDSTGFDDANRGVPIGSGVSDLLNASGGVVTLDTRLSTAQEKALSWSTTSSVGPQRPQSESTIHAAGAQACKWPCIIEARIKLPPGATFPGGAWPAFWLEDVQPTWANTGELDFEWRDTGNVRPNYITGTSVNDSTINTTDLLLADGQFHIYTFLMPDGGGPPQYLIDGNVAATSSKRLDAAITGPMFWWLRNGVDSVPPIFSETYTTSAWAGKDLPMQVDWIRIWTKPTSTDIGYKGVVSTINVDFTGSIAATLPSETALWGKTGLTEYLISQPMEDNEPGASQTPLTGAANTWYSQTTATGQFWGPTFEAWNRTSRSFTGSSFDRPGRQLLNLVAWDDTNGGMAGFGRVVVNVGPKVTLSSQSWTVGTPVSLDVYAAADAGVLLPKVLNVSGLPTGVNFSLSSGLVTGTPSGASSGNFSVTCVNSLGQTTTATVPYTVSASAPTYPWTSWDTLVADYRPDVGVTTSGSNITTVANQKTGGGDLTTDSATAPISLAPTLTANAKNGLPAFTFSSDRSANLSVLRASASATVSTFMNGSNVPFTWIIVYDATDMTNTQEIAGWSKTVSASDWQSSELILRTTGTASGYRKRSGSTDIQNTTFGNGQASNTWKILAIRYTGSTVDIYDTSLTPIVTGGTLTNTAALSSLFFSIGGVATQGSTNPRYASGTAAIGLMGDNVIASSARSSAEVQAAIQAEATRWGITLN